MVLIMYFKILLYVIPLVNIAIAQIGIGGSDVGDYASVFDQELYERVIDDAKCDEQLEYLTNSSLLLSFADLSGKIPVGMLLGNFADLGAYHQCLNLKYVTEEIDIEGKYCLMQIPLVQNQENVSDTSEFASLDDYPKTIDVFPQLSKTTLNDIKQVMRAQRYAHTLTGAGQPMVSRIFPSTFAATLKLSLGTCIPKVCTSKKAVNYFFDRIFGENSLNNTNITYEEYFCRLPKDKPMVVADYVAIAAFGLIGIITVISTSYDLLQMFFFKKKNSEISTLYRCFSVYTNTKRFLTFNTFPGALECIDGIRAISMMWVIFGHVYSLNMTLFLLNPSAVGEWLTSFKSTWINSAPITVDTFFLLSGILCVYTVIGKSSRRRFITSIHFFYLYRILRILPLLAAVILLQVSAFHKLSDGPMWINMGYMVYMCRQKWWSTLLHVQNYLKPIQICLPQTWYLAVDLQLYILSPAVIAWLFGRRVVAWCALSAAVLLSLSLSTVFSFIYNYPAALANPVRGAEQGDYFTDYYINTLTRASPFAIGMMYGYLLHLCKGKKIRINKIQVWVLWLIAFVFMAFCIFTIYPIMQFDYDMQAFDNFLNAYMRGIWAIGVGWMIFACVHGYGGPINWFLSLQVWKVPSRLSYAMYLTHFSLIMVANSSMVNTHYFTDGDTMYRAMSDLMFTTIAAFILCITIDAPFSTIQKLLLGGGAKKSPQKQQQAESQNVNTEDERTNRSINGAKSSL